MHPTRDELRAEILDGPLADELSAGVESHFHNARDQEVADVLNRKDLAGYVPARHVEVTLNAFPALGALIHWAMMSQKLPTEFGGGDAPFPIYALFWNLWRVSESVTKAELRADVAAVDYGLDAIAQTPPAAVIPDGFRDALVAGEVKVSRAERLWGLGVTVTAADVGSAR